MFSRIVINKKAGATVQDEALQCLALVEEAVGLYPTISSELPGTVICIHRAVSNACYLLADDIFILMPYFYPVLVSVQRLCFTTFLYVCPSLQSHFHILFHYYVFPFHANISSLYFSSI